MMHRALTRRPAIRLSSESCQSTLRAEANVEQQHIAILGRHDRFGVGHAVGGVGSRLAPGLTEIGSFRRVVELRRSLIEPDAEIRPW